MHQKIYNETRPACANFPTSVVDHAPEAAPEKNAAQGPHPRGQFLNNMPHLFVFCPDDLDL